MITIKRLDYPFGSFLTVPSGSKAMVQEFSMIDFEECRNMCSFLQRMYLLSFDCYYAMCSNHILSLQVKINLLRRAKSVCNCLSGKVYYLGSCVLW